MKLNNLRALVKETLNHRLTEEYQDKFKMIEKPPYSKISYPSVPNKDCGTTYTLSVNALQMVQVSVCVNLEKPVLLVLRTLREVNQLSWLLRKPRSNIFTKDLSGDILFLPQGLDNLFI